jgi:hypothetical protein
MGRKVHRPDPATRRQVEAMCAYGMPEPIIARLIGVDPKTLRKHYRDELDTGQEKATAKVAECLFRKATGDGPQSVTAAIFWLKTRGQWREAPQAHEVDVFDVSRLSSEELDARIAEVNRELGYEKRKKDPPRMIDITPSAADRRKNAPPV